MPLWASVGKLGATLRAAVQAVRRCALLVHTGHREVAVHSLMGGGVAKTVRSVTALTLRATGLA